MAEPQSPVPSREPLARPLFWRVPLIVFVLLGLAGLYQLDALLQRDAEREAAGQAGQAQALVASYLRDRATDLHALTLALGALGERPGRATRFVAMAREVHASTPDVLTLSLVDTLGRTHERVVAPGTEGATDAAGGGGVERALAMTRARASGRVALASTVPMRTGAPGMVLYDPILEGGRVAGFVAASLSYQVLFDEALAAPLHGKYAWRLRDAHGARVADWQRFPEQPQRVVAREVPMPGGGTWALEVAVPRFEPLLPRVLAALGGLLLLASVVALVLREAARAERLAEHSFELELVARDLLDANVALEERAQQVTEANRAKSRFLANVSHELRTPLNAIVGYNSLALDGMYGELRPPLREAHQRVRLAAGHLLELVDDVLDLSKIEGGRMAMDAGPVDVAALLAAVRTVVQPAAAVKDLHVCVVVDRQLPRLTTDPRHLRQIMLNLASNAVKFTEAGAVTLVARRDPAAPGERLVLGVEDTGIGIAAGDQQRIFDEFEQVRAGSRGDSLQRGTGLGLTIARKLARVLGGDIAVTSAPGAGARFTLTLPLTPQAMEGASGVATARDEATVRDDAEALLAQVRDVAVTRDADAAHVHRTPTIARASGVDSSAGDH